MTSHPYFRSTVLTHHEKGTQMTNPYAPPPAKRLTRSKSNKVLGGVCGGVAAYLNMDATLVRVLTVVLSLFTGVPIVAYIVMLLVVPEEDSQTPNQPVTPNQGSGYPYPPAQFESTPQPTAGDQAVWGSAGAPWEQQPSADAPFDAQQSMAQRVTPNDPKKAEPSGWDPVPNSGANEANDSFGADDPTDSGSDSEGDAPYPTGEDPATAGSDVAGSDTAADGSGSDTAEAPDTAADQPAEPGTSTEQDSAAAAWSEGDSAKDDKTS